MGEALARFHGRLIKEANCNEKVDLRNLVRVIRN
jgi:hypothetical protein